MIGPQLASRDCGFHTLSRLNFRNASLPGSLGIYAELQSCNATLREGASCHAALNASEYNCMHNQDETEQCQIAKPCHRKFFIYSQGGLAGC